MLTTLIQDPQIQEILLPDGAAPSWQSDLDKLIAGDTTLNRHSAGEDSIRAFQRLLIFLGYSTSSGGSFGIDGDFGRGTNRGLAQFMFDHDLAPANITRKTLTYNCTWQTARKLIKSIPDVQLTVDVLEAMLEAAKTAIETNKVNCGSFDEAIFQLNALDSRQHLNCRKINERYGEFVAKAVQAVKEKKGVTIQPEWILAVIRQETAGVVRPRFEQHILTRRSKKTPEISLKELRFQSMSFGLGQIMGFNYQNVGAASAEDLYTSPMEEQIAFIARFLTRLSRTKNAVKKMNPTADDFKAVAKFYNGSGFAAHHYDEKLRRWFNEFKLLRT